SFNQNKMPTPNSIQSKSIKRLPPFNQTRATSLLLPTSPPNFSNNNNTKHSIKPKTKYVPALPPIARRFD
ncbi:MAG TPA: hypothetical protein VNL15_05145, partial [Dehalococcoidia bacterium]|nr:hypothetical protein [Dehalococcoidia bacterium]